MLTVQHAAALLNKSPAIIKRWCKLGTIQASKFGKQWAIPESEIERIKTNQPKRGRKPKEITK